MLTIYPALPPLPVRFYVVIPPEGGAIRAVMKGIFFFNLVEDRVLYDLRVTRSFIDVAFMLKLY